MVTAFCVSHKSSSTSSKVTKQFFIDGVELPTTRLDELTASGQQAAPGAQVELPPTAVFDPGNFIISFQPQVGAVIEEFTQGEHEGKVRYWRIGDGREKSRVYTWQFDTD
ncbi:MAG: hypothetical protein EBQ54_05315 [Actinobacteria bacterium]|nr:hypothetical protein [Actinomycetota bacterium]